MLYNFVCLFPLISHGRTRSLLLLTAWLGGLGLLLICCCCGGWVVAEDAAEASVDVGVCEFEFEFGF